MLTIDPRVAVIGGCPSTVKRTFPAMTTKTVGVSGWSRGLKRVPGDAELYVASCSGSLMICSCQFALPAWILSHQTDFHIKIVWYLSVGSQLLQAGINLVLLQRELRKKLKFEDGPDFVPASATAS